MALTDIRSGLATRLATISGLTAYAEAPHNPTMPCAIIESPEGEYDMAMANGGVTHRLTVVLLVSKAPGDVIAQQALDAYIAKSGATSVRAAVQGDKTLGGKASTSQVARYYDYGGFEYPAGSTVIFLGCRFEVRAWEA